MASLSSSSSMAAALVTAAEMKAAITNVAANMKADPCLNKACTKQSVRDNKGCCQDCTLRECSCGAKFAARDADDRHDAFPGACPSCAQKRYKSNLEFYAKEISKQSSSSSSSSAAEALVAGAEADNTKQAAKKLWRISQYRVRCRNGTCKRFSVLGADDGCCSDCVQLTCACGVKFARTNAIDPYDDHPNLCSTCCNKQQDKSWEARLKEVSAQVASVTMPVATAVATALTNVASAVGAAAAAAAAAAAPKEDETKITPALSAFFVARCKKRALAQLAEAELQAAKDGLAAHAPEDDDQRSPKRHKPESKEEVKPKPWSAADEKAASLSSLNAAEKEAVAEVAVLTTDTILLNDDAGIIGDYLCDEFHGSAVSKQLLARENGKHVNKAINEDGLFRGDFGETE